MKNQIEIIYEGNLRTRAIHLASKSEIITDAPIDNQGKGERFSPTDLVAAALGSCMLTIMGISARVQGIDISGTKVKVEKNMGEEPRKISEINLQIIFNSQINDKHKTILERAAKHCPVGKTLDGNIEENIKFIYA